MTPTSLETLRARLEQIKQEAEKATKGPWVAWSGGGYVSVGHTRPCEVLEKKPGSVYGMGRNQAAEDYIFCASARSTVPRLVEVVEEFMKEHPPCYCHELTEELCMVCRLFQRCSEILGGGAP